VATAPDGTIWVTDRCGNSGAGGTTCGGGTRAGVNPVFQFDSSGKLLKSFGAGMLVSPHKLTVDKDGNRIQIFDQDGKFIAQWFQFGRPSGIFIDKRTDTIYVADSESRDGRTNTGQLGLPQTGYAHNPGARRGIRIGSARDGSVKFFVPDPCSYPYAGGSSFAEGVTIDQQGNLYGADFLMDVRKFVST
jgi:hypothetical protein